jgi:hypothetical protein
MAFKAHLMGSGIAAGAANSILGGVIATEAGAGTTRTDATRLSLVSIHNIATAANNSGVILPPGNGTADGMQPGDTMVIYNGDSNTLLLYPPAGGQLNGGTASTGTVQIPTKTSVQVICLTSLTFIVSGPTT